MRLLSRSSISRKLTGLNMLVTGAALLLACLGFLAYDLFTFRNNLVASLSAQAQIIGFNSVSALVFNDPQSAEKTLAALENLPNIRSAGILTADGRPFAQFVRPGAQPMADLPLLPAGAGEVYRFSRNQLVLVHAITLQDQRVGSVYIRSDLREMSRRVKRYAVIAATVLLLCLLAALAVSAVFGRRVVKPITGLADVARSVSRDRNYSIRAAPTGDRDEVAVLIEAFNDMLAQIAQRDAALQQARDELEQRVQERTTQLVAANKELEAFSYSVSHDLRGPLEIISSITYILQEDYAAKLDAEGREFIRDAQVAGRRMSELIDQLLLLSRATTSEMRQETVDLSALARSVAEQLKRHDPQRQAEFAIREDAVVTGDSTLLRVVIDNLLGNAWKYTSSRTRARIEFGWCEESGERVYFVKDNGVGFDPASAARLFQPFHRLHTAADFPGTGIGLATVQRIIRRNGGRIWAQSAVGQGAAFYFTWQEGKSLQNSAGAGL
jgi:signal transduction histidine kinase